MHRFFQKLNFALQRFMYGRYGVDELGLFLLASGMIIALLSLFGPLALLSLPAFVLIVFSYIRCFSKNLDKRRRELYKFTRIKKRISDKMSLQKKKYADRKTHKYFKCKLCKTVLRVPRNKGKVQITCPKCGSRIIKKT